jgi:hypothetical protein
MDVVLRWTGIAVSVVAFAVAAAGSRPSGEAHAKPLTTCDSPLFRGEHYHQYTLRRTRIRPSGPIGTARVYRNLLLLGCEPVAVRVHRIRDIGPRLAVSYEGSRRRLLIRLGACGRYGRGGPVDEGRLLRCLRRETARPRR